MFRRTALVALFSLCVVFSSVICAGCGGSGESDPLNQRQFETAADSICANAGKQRKVAAEGLEEGSGGSPVEAEDGVDQLLAPVETMISELDDLNPPAKQKAELEGLVEALEDGISELEADPGGIDSAMAFAAADQRAEQAGLPECAI